MGAVDAEDATTLRPGVEAEVIDEQGQPLADGQPGRIKVKSDSLVDGYANDPEATARVFKDGWFYSGDMGTLVGPRRLKVLGRLDDILNIGGIKILPTTLEDLVVGTRLVAEAGVTSIPGPEASVDLAAITREITSKIWPAALGRAHVMAMSRLPRTETGKLQRHGLRAAFQKQAGRR